jgi:hypothetical protein
LPSKTETLPETLPSEVAKSGFPSLLKSATTMAWAFNGIAKSVGVLKFEPTHGEAPYPVVVSPSVRTTRTKKDFIGRKSVAVLLFILLFKRGVFVNE